MPENMGGKSDEDWVFYFIDQLVKNFPVSGVIRILPESISGLSLEETKIFRQLNRGNSIQNWMVKLGYIGSGDNYSKPITRIGWDAKKAGGHFAYETQQEELNKPVAPVTNNYTNTGNVTNSQFMQGEGNQDLRLQTSAPTTTPNKYATKNVLKKSMSWVEKIMSKSISKVVVTVVSGILTAIFSHYFKWPH